MQTILLRSVAAVRVLPAALSNNGLIRHVEGRAENGAFSI
jgi:hypothetical protein